MRIAASVRVDPALTRVLKRLQMPELGKPLGRFLVKAGMLVLREAASNQIIRGGRFRGPSGPRGGKGKLLSTKPHPTRLTSRSGELRRSLGQSRGLDRGGLPRYVEVGSDLVYARVHELGLGRYPKRAFLAPAVEAVAPQFEALLADEIAKVMK